MDGWWNEIDDEIRHCLERNGAMTPAEIGRQLHLSESAVTSVVSMLAQEGRVRIERVELPPPEDDRQLSF
jgi:DNA-binding Lrp family transcriptional regulator